MNQAQLLKVMEKYLKNNYEKVITNKKFLIAKGDIPICLCAHLDTVGYMPPKQIFQDTEAGVMWSPQLLGADDRAGIYAIIDIIERGYRPHIIFTTDEEIGGLGAQAVVTKRSKSPFGNFKFIIQLDRHGSEDSVYYSCDNKDFEEYINSFGFETAQGSFTDICFIAPTWGVAAVNLSVGYYNEHSLGEYLVLEELEDTIEKVVKILEDAEFAPEFEYIEAPVVNYSNYTYAHMRPEKGCCEFCYEPYGKNYKVAYGMKLCQKCWDACYTY